MKIKKKTPRYIIILHTSLTKIMIISYTVLEIWHVTHVIFIFHFLLFFALLPPNDPKNQNFKKMREKYLKILPFYTCVPKIMIKWCTIPEIWFATNGWTDRWRDVLTDGQTDGWKKWHIEVGVPPKSQAKIKNF